MTVAVEGRRRFRGVLIGTEGNAARAPARGCRARRACRGAAADRRDGGRQDRAQRRRHRRIAPARQARASARSATERPNQAERAGQIPAFQRFPAAAGARPARGSSRGRVTDGRQRQPARIVADRRRGRPREVDRPPHRDRRHGGRDREGGALALRHRDRRPRRDRSEERRAPAAAPHAGGRHRRELRPTRSARTMPGDAIRPRRSATPSPIRCRRSNTAASPRSPRSR